MTKRRNNGIKRRYNPYAAVSGFGMMLAGAVIVVVIFYMQYDVTMYRNWIVIGVAMTAIGWLLQILFGKRPSAHRR